MTYARARLWLGISGVGIMVVLAVAALAFEWPQRIFPADPQGPLAELFFLSWIVTLYSVLHVPMDYLGGYWLPCYFSRQCLLFPFFASQYVRGVLVQGLILLVSSFAVLQSGQFGGRAAAVLTIGVIMLVLIERQDSLARFIAGLSVTESMEVQGKPVISLSGMDAGFSGGLSGLPGRERIVMPAVWRSLLPKQAVALEIERRMAALRTGSRLRGLVLAMTFNLGGFLLSSHMPNAGVDSVAGLFTTSLWFTVWSFLGLLTLPTLSRAGVYEVDHQARLSGTAPEAFALTVSEIDHLQDDEPRRPRGIEAIFHPIPSVTARLRNFDANTPATGAWNAARYALYLSWPCLGFLNRAVHCNSGRPELWAMLPVD
jgi:hypothetical protein